MTYYEKRLEHDLNRIRLEIASVAEKIQNALKQAVHALLTGDQDQSYAVMLGDHAINRQVRKIDDLCHSFVALHLPSAGHLRFVSSVLRLDRELERIGDYAVTISRQAVRLSNPPPPTVARDIELLAHQSGSVLSQAIRAFDTANADLARGTTAMAVQVRETFDKVFIDLVEEGSDLSPPLPDLFGLLAVFSCLERAADRSKNICEETLFAVTGEMKQPKTYRILFVDEGNDFFSQIAEAYARKAFKTLGRYTSAGWKPATGFSEDFFSFMASLGHDLTGRSPVLLNLTRDELSEYHVIVALEKGVEKHLRQLPFQTILLRWNCEPKEVDADADPDAYRRAVHRIIAVKVGELMEALRGEEAV